MGHTNSENVTRHKKNPRGKKRERGSTDSEIVGK